MKRLMFFSFLIFPSLAFANILGNMQTFSPTPDSLFFENVHSSKTLQKNHFNLGVYTSFVRNELSVYDNMATQHFNKYKDKAWTLDFVAAWGITDRLEVFYSLPVFLDQSPDSGQFQNNYISSGANTHRPGAKFDISNSATGGLAVIGSVDIPVSKQDPYTGLNPSPIYNLELAYDIRNPVSAYSFNAGYRFREPGATPNNAYFYPLKDQILYSLGYVTALNTDHRYHVELFGAFSADKSPHKQAKHTSALEGLVAYKQRLLKGLWGHIGATGEILSEGLAPQYRIYAGVNWFFGLGDKKEEKEMPIAAQDVVLAESLSISPEYLEMYVGEEKPIQVSGGKNPMKYRLSKNFGEFSEATSTYQAPSTPGNVQLFVQDESGAEKSIEIRVIEIPKANREIVISNLQFKFNSSDLTAASDRILNSNVEKLKNEKLSKIIVVGHTDNIGKDEYNLKLSRQRAQAVARQLREKLQLLDNQVQAIGMGESQPLTSNKTDAGRQKNRRVELKIYF